MTLGTVLQNRYQVITLLGQGGMGAVYQASDLRLQKIVALKENVGGDPHQFQREALLLANLRHPNLPHVTDHFVEPNGAQYLVMDFVEGEDLESRLQRQGALQENQVLGWFEQILDAVAYLHSNGVIHRDIKPSNIKITSQDKAVLVDFGIAKVYQPGQRTASGARMGTSGYASPEQYRGGTDQRSDIYSLGATLYAALVGGDPPDALALEKGTATLVPPRSLNPGVSVRIEQAIMRAMALLPQQRFQSVDEMRLALLQIPPTMPVRQPPKVVQLPRRPLGIYAIGLGIFACLGIVGIGLAFSVFGAPTPARVAGRLTDTPIVTQTRVVSPMPLSSTPTPALMTPSALPLTPTAVPPQATTKQQVNVRQGPSTNFAIAGKMPANTVAAVVGKSEDGKWFQVAFPDAAHPAWVPGEFVTVSGNIDQLPVIAVAPLPTATRGAVVADATKPLATTPTQAFPPARGSIGFVVKDDAQNAYVLYSLGIEPRTYSPNRVMGSLPFDLAQNTNAAPFAMSPTSARVAYIFSSASVRDTLRVTDPTNPDLFKDLISHQGISSPTFSPDGKNIAYIGLDKSGTDFGMQFIYTIPADGNTPQRFFPSNPADLQKRPGEVFRGLTWGKTHLLFVSNLTGQFEIWRLNGDGGGPMQLTNDKRENMSPAWAPDGKTYAYSSKQVDGSYQIMIANAFDGSAPRKLTNAGHNFSPTFSPDGNWIAFMSNRGGRMDIWVTNKNGGNVQLLTDKFDKQGQLPGGWR